MRIISLLVKFPITTKYHCATSRRLFRNQLLAECHMIAQNSVQIKKNQSFQKQVYK
eukprot:UN02264